MLFSSSNEISLENLNKHKFTHQPFLDEIATDERFFTTNAIAMVINTVAQTVNQTDNEICIIKGEKGIGKTTLANYLHNSQQPYTSFLFTAQRKNKLASILKAIINDDDFESDDTQHLAKQAAIEVFHVLKNNQQPVLLIDNAHLIKENTLLTLIRFITAIKQQGVGRLKLILLAEKSIENTVDKIPDHHISANSIHSVLLRPFSRNEIKDYLDQRIANAGGNNNILNQKQMDAIITESAGIPAQINVSAVNILDKSKRTGLKLNKNIQLGGYIAAAIVFIGLAFLYNSNSTKSDTTDKQDSNPTAIEEVVSDPIINEITTNVSEEDLFEINESSEIITDDNNQDNTVTLQTSVDELIASQTTDTDIETEKSNDVVDKLTQETPLTELSSTSSGETSDSTEETTSDTLETLEINKLEVVSTTKTFSNTTKQEVITENTLYSHRWLLEQDSKSFTLQLIGTANYEKLMKFAETIVTNCTLAYFRTVRNRSPWHVLLCGPYKDAQAASNDIRNLPAEIQRNKPWPRDLATIQQKIRQP